MPHSTSEYVMSSDKAEEYRRLADEADDHANTVQDVQAQETWRKAATCWRELAAYAERKAAE